MYFAQRNAIVFPYGRTQHRSVRIVLRNIAFHRFGTEIRIAVAASVQTGIVRTDVDALRAAAFGTLIFVLTDSEWNASDLRQQRFIYSRSVLYAECRKIGILCATFD